MTNPRSRTNIATMNVQPSALVGQQCVAVVSLQVPKNLGWIFREQFTADYGIDAQIEVVSEGRATGRLLALQIKSGASWFEEPVEGGWVFRPRDDHVTYWTTHALPVLVVLVDLDTETAFWQLMTKERLISTGKGWKVTVPRDQTISESMVEKLSEAAEGDPYELRLRQLQLARPWMLHLAEGGQLTVEMEEWVNKSSGRASIAMTARNENGEVVATREWPWLILPYADYAKELPRLFPWADLSIDIDSDDLHDQYVAECGHWDSEDEMYFFSETFGDWLTASRHEEGLHAVSEDGEVAQWRLDVGLGPLGRAFLVTDDWLSHDQLPPLV